MLYPRCRDPSERSSKHITKFDGVLLCTQVGDVSLIHTKERRSNLIHLSKSHALVYKGIRDLEFPIEFDQVWKMTALRYKTQPDRLEAIYDENQCPSDHLLLYPDSEEETEDEKKSDKVEPSSIEQSEHWNLVDVMPSFHRGANNGNEGESVFQQAATSFMPGVRKKISSVKIVY